MKNHFRNCTLYLEDVSNIESWIVDKHKRKQSRSDTGAIMGLGGEIKIIKLVSLGYFDFQ